MKKVILSLLTFILFMNVSAENQKTKEHNHPLTKNELAKIDKKLSEIQDRNKKTKIPVVEKVEADHYEVEKPQEVVYKYHLNFILELDKDLWPKSRPGQYVQQPLLTFSLLNSKGKLASPRFGEFFYISPSTVEYRIDVPTRGPFYIKYMDFNMQADDVEHKQFPIDIERILKEDEKLKNLVDVKGFGPFTIGKDDYEATFIIRITSPSNPHMFPLGPYHFNHVEFLKKKDDLF